MQPGVKRSATPGTCPKPIQPLPGGGGNRAAATNITWGSVAPCQGLNISSLVQTRNSAALHSGLQFRRPFRGSRLDSNAPSGSHLNFAFFGTRAPTERGDYSASVYSGNIMKAYSPISSRTYFAGGLPKESTVSLYFLRSKAAPAFARARSRNSRCSVAPIK